MFNSLSGSLQSVSQKLTRTGSDTTETDTTKAAEDVEGTENIDDSTISLTEKVTAMSHGKRVITQKHVDDIFDDVELQLLTENVHVDVVGAIKQKVSSKIIGDTFRLSKDSEQQLNTVLTTVVEDIISIPKKSVETHIDDTDGPLVILFIGINGVGKTTSIAKLAKHLHTTGYNVSIANGDTYRAGANEQINTHATRIDVPVMMRDQGSDPTSVIYDAVEHARANDIDVVLADTAGRLHTDSGLLDQISKIRRVVDPDLVFYVDEAIAGQDAINRVSGFDEAATVDGIILTKAEAPKSGGAAMSMCYVTEQPIYYLGTGQKYTDLVPFDEQMIAKQLVTVN